jgi:hypothetical protein
MPGNAMAESAAAAQTTRAQEDTAGPRASILYLGITLSGERGEGERAHCRRSVVWPSPIGIAARGAPNRGFCAGLLRVGRQPPAAGRVQSSGLLLIAGTSLPAAMFREGFAM